MIQIAVLAVSIGLIVLGIKGFTASGIPLTKTTALKGTQGDCDAIAFLIDGYFPLLYLAVHGLRAIGSALAD